MNNLKMEIRNVYCVGRNYKLHAAELGNEVPSEPLIFLKPTHAITQMNNQEIVLPRDKGEIHYEAELVLYIGSEYEKGKTVEQLVDSITLGIDFTMRDLQSQIKSKGVPWLPAKGFKNSGLIGTYVPLSEMININGIEFYLDRNGQLVQHGKVSDMIFSLQEIIDYIAEHFGLGVGDLIYTGTPAGVGKVEDGDILELKLLDRIVGKCTVRF